MELHSPTSPYLTKQASYLILSITWLLTFLGPSHTDCHATLRRPSCYDLFQCKLPRLLRRPLCPHTDLAELFAFSSPTNNLRLDSISGFPYVFHVMSLSLGPKFNCARQLRRCALLRPGSGPGNGKKKTFDSQTFEVLSRTHC